MSRRARSLDVLVAEVNTAAPHRSKTLGPDGWLGDQSHQGRSSRHNPNNAGVVCGQDITHDPAGGCDIHAIARALVARYRAAYVAGARATDEYRAHGLNPDLEYVISNRKTAGRSNGWVWKAYTGANPHDKHAHFGVGRGPDSEPTAPYDDTDPWGITPATQEDDDMPTAKEIAAEVVSWPIDLADGTKQPLWAVLRFVQTDAHAAAALSALAAKHGDVDEAQIAALVVAGLDTKAIADALSKTQAEQLLDLLAERLKD
jgi:hypothetical protein